MDWMDFLTVIVLAFAIVMILAGLFTAFFGSGRGRTIGLLMILVGLIVGGVWIYLCLNVEPFYHPEHSLADIVAAAIQNIIGVVIGALVAVGIFLVGVMKS